MLLRILLLLTSSVRSFCFKHNTISTPEPSNLNLKTPAATAHLERLQLLAGAAQQRCQDVSHVCVCCWFRGKHLEQLTDHIHEGRVAGLHRRRGQKASMAAGAVLFSIGAARVLLHSAGCAKTRAAC
jgi:hypothetical protein